MTDELLKSIKSATTEYLQEYLRLERDYLDGIKGNIQKDPPTFRSYWEKRQIESEQVIAAIQAELALRAS